MKIMLTGYNGRMGKAIIEAAYDAQNSKDIEIAVGVDINPAPINFSFPVFYKPSDYTGELDVIVDFSHHSAIDALLAYAESRKVPLVVATTGHTQEEFALIKASSANIPIFRSANMSVGVNLVAQLAKKAAALLGDSFDIEIIERHHNKKEDAPSGTAYLIGDEIKSVLNDCEYVYDRHNVRQPRDKREIGLHAVRGGTIIGDHEVIFAGANELISISHSAQSREMFAMGALTAARFIVDKSPGLYSMNDLINI